jgi:hypothetical protein
VEHARDGYTKSAIDKFVAKGQLHLALQFAGADVQVLYRALIDP